MLEDSDIFQPNFIVLLAVLIYLAQALLKEDQSNFRRLSLRFHPERLERCSEENEKNDERSGTVDRSLVDAKKSAFAVVAEAFEVLSDPLKRAVYDQYGEEGLKRGSVRGPDGCVPPYKFHGQPLKTYREFFGTENPYGDLLDNLASPLPLQDCPETQAIKKKDDAVIKQLPLTLDEVFYGGIKKMKIQRLVLVGDGDNAIDDNEKESVAEARTALQEKILSIPIMPGIPAGAKIVFTEEGDQGPTKIPADVIFITEDKPHETFKREGSNLRMTVDVFLREALNGTIVTVNTIDDRILRVPITSVISPDYEKTIPGEGLPLVEDPERRGDLVIDFRIEFPSYLSPASKSYVNRAFDPREESDDEIVENGEGNQRVHRMVLDGKMYMRTHEVSEMCRL